MKNHSTVYVFRVVELGLQAQPERAFSEKENQPVSENSKIIKGIIIAARIKHCVIFIYAQY